MKVLGDNYFKSTKNCTKEEDARLGRQKGINKHWPYLNNLLMICCQSHHIYPKIAAGFMK